MPSDFWTDARARMMLDPTVTNLNTGSFGPSPRVVFDRVTELRRRLGEEPMDFLLRGLPPLLWSAREALARFLGGDPRRLVFTVNVTAAVNLVASSLRLASPGEILLTDHEYGAMHWTWERAAQRQGLTLRTFPLPILAPSPQEIVEAARAAMTERTRLFFFSHVLSPTGLVLPARAVRGGPETRRRDGGGRGARAGLRSAQPGGDRRGLLRLELSQMAARADGFRLPVPRRRRLGAGAAVAGELGLAAGARPAGRAGRIRLDAAAAPSGVRGDARRVPVAGRADGDSVPARDRLWAHSASASAN